MAAEHTTRCLCTDRNPVVNTSEIDYEIFLSTACRRVEVANALDIATITRFT